jgi:hypothetical protein
MSGRWKWPDEVPYQRGGAHKHPAKPRRRGFPTTCAGEEVEVEKVVGDVTLGFLSHYRLCSCNVRRAKQASKMVPKMAISPDKKSQRVYAVQMMEEGALRCGNGGGRGDGSDTTGTFPGDRAGCVERGRAGDVDSDRAKLLSSS